MGLKSLKSDSVLGACYSKDRKRGLRGSGEARGGRPQLPAQRSGAGEHPGEADPAVPWLPTPAGLTEDEDVRAMLRGSRFRKIRSRTWHKERLYRLQEDGLSVWFQRRIPRAPSQHICESESAGRGAGWGQCPSPARRPDRAVRVASLPAVFLQHIEAVREGHQSEGLRRFGGAFAPARCLTIAFRGRRKNLDLAAPTAEEAQRWVRGLAKLRARLDAMTQRERLDQYPAQGGAEGAPGGREGWPCPWRTPGQGEA